MLPGARDRFEEWLSTPLSGPPEDPRFEMRRASPSEYERIFDLLDGVFGKRSRAAYDWLYRRNPLGRARCWMVVERESGRLVGTGASWPWPIARGTQALDGIMAGDVAVVPEWQRKRLSELRRRTRVCHPMTPETTSFGWANELSVARNRYHGRASLVQGPLPQAVLRIHSGRIGRLRARLRFGSRKALRIEELGRFDERFDSVTERCMSWEGYWCPHSAEFLNWRYAAHPTRDYRALAAFSGDALAGYAVVRPEGRTALLMELAAPAGSHAARALLGAVHDTAREADCRRVSFHAPARFRHWPLLRACGFEAAAGRHHLIVQPHPEPGVLDLDRWQLVPGDADDA